MIGHKIRIVLMIYRFQLPLGRSIDRCFSSGSIAKKARWFFRDHATASALRKFLENNCNNKDSGRAVRLINGSFTEFCRGSFVRLRSNLSVARFDQGCHHGRRLIGDC
jgi:hypothetical protein